jgi:hypothetical protein
LRLGQQISQEVVEVLLRTDDVLALVQECCELAAVSVEGPERIGVQDAFEPLACGAGLISGLRRAGRDAW